VETGKSTDSVAHGWQPMGSHHVDLELAPGETREVNFLLGYWENPQDDKFDPPNSQTINKRAVKPVIDKYLQPAVVEAAFAALRDYWTGLLGVIQVETGNEHVDRMVNIWNAYQNMVTFNMSRSASGFESGIGRGMGFRDSNQDLLGFVQMIPARARERILDIAATQLETGGAYHQYQPLTKRGNNDIGGGFNDDPAGWCSAWPRTSRRRATRASSTSSCHSTMSRARRRHSTSTCSVRSHTRSTGSVPTACH
jgi:cellobiose phosphorylase